MNFNKVVIAGNLTRDPEIRSLPSGQQVASFGVASNRYYTVQQGNKQGKTEFHNIVAFGKLAEICGNYLSKGRLVLIEGHLQTNSWEGQDGAKKYRTEIIAENMQMGPRPAGQDTTNQAAPTQGRDPDSKDAGEIPVIEAEEPIKPEAEPIEDKTDKEEKVDLKNIPF